MFSFQILTQFSSLSLLCLRSYLFYSAGKCVAVTMFRDSRGGVGALATERSFRLVPLVVVVATLCAISFYLGNLYNNEKSIIDEIKSEEQVSEKSGNCVENIKVDPFPECNITLQDHTPCTDPKVNIVPIFQFEFARSCSRNGVPEDFTIRLFQS